MADSDQSLNNLRYNQVTQGLEGFGGGSPMWTPLVLVADGGISQLTGDVTAGPGVGSQVASISSATVTGKLLTGFVSGAGTVAATDTILQAVNKLAGNDALKLPLAGGTITGNLLVDGNSTTVGSVILSADKIWTLSQNGSGTLILADTTDSVSIMLVSGNSGGSLDLLVQAQLSGGVLVDKISQLGSGYVDIESQTVIGANAAPAASAVCTMVSTTQGFLPPLLTTTQKVAITSPAEGLIVYDTTLHKLCVFTGSVWETITSA